MHAPLSQYCVIGIRVYNSVRYYWLQIMINNNNIDKNGTLPHTSDLIQRPLCTLWYIQYHNHAWVHLVWKKKGRGGINGTALTGKEKTSHLQALCWQCLGEQTQSQRLLGVIPKKPLIHRLTYSPASVQQQTLRESNPPTPPSPLFPSTNMIPPEGSPQTSFLINACGWWDHPVSAN